VAEVAVDAEGIAPDAALERIAADLLVALLQSRGLLPLASVAKVDDVDREIQHIVTGTHGYSPCRPGRQCIREMIGSASARVDILPRNAYDVVGIP